MRRVLFILSTICLAAALQAAPVVLLVQDSTGALLPHAVVKTCRHTSDTTRFDGLCKIAEDLLPCKVTVSAEGYYDNSLRLKKTDAGKTLFLVLKKKAVARPKIGSKTDSGIRIRGKASLDEVELLGATDMVYYTMEAPSASKMAVAEEAAVAPAKPNAAAGMLTAGEVNDFAKWYLWQNVLEQSHKRYIRDWRITTDSRYVCQLTNTAGYPLANRSVQLTDQEGHTLFQARTDNTGTAELWNGLTGKRAKHPLYIVAEGQRVEAVPFGWGRNEIVLDEVCEAPEEADVFFIVDATGSMGDELRYLREEMKDVIRRSQSAVEGLRIRTGALVYRDHTDAYLTRISRLSEDIEETQAFLDKQQAHGGGDYEEAIPEALMAACNAAGWKDEARTRIAFLILDAPCHKDSATIALLHEQVLNAAALGIRLVPVVCSGLRESGELLMRSLALATNGTSFFLTDDSGIGDEHLKPTTDTLKVEHLNDMMVRTITSFCRMPVCDAAQWAEEPTELTEVEHFLPAPFDADDLDSVPAIGPEHALQEVLRVRPNPCTDYVLVDLPLGAEALYLTDVSGKTVNRYAKCPAETEGMTVKMSGLPTGVYFLKAFADGRWYVAKIIKK